MALIFPGINLLLVFRRARFGPLIGLFSKKLGWLCRQRSDALAIKSVHIDSNKHVLSGVSFTPAPNVNERPPGATLDLIVIHSISVPAGEFGGQGINDLFMNTLNPEENPAFVALSRLRVSAHIVIRRAGEVIQYAPCDRRAWHAGKSSYDGRSNCNDFSVGIELEGTDTRPFEKEQYQVLAKVTTALLNRYKTLSENRIVGHKDIAIGRKTDPGPFFEWDFLERFV